MGVSNLEARIKRLENTSSNEFGVPTDGLLYPIRKLLLSEEKSHGDDGTSYPVLFARWDKPAGALLPDSIRLIHNDTVVLLNGTAVAYRMAGYSIGDRVIVKVTAIYSNGNSSTVIAEKTITGDIEPPSMPTNLTVIGGFRTLTLKWENPTTEDFSHVEIWESVDGPDLETSERIAQAYGTEFVRSNCGVLETRWFWIRALDVNGNFSDFTSVASGTTTAIAMEDVPENTIGESMLVSELASEINKIPAIEANVNLINTVDLPAYEQRIATNTAAIQTEQTARANADSALSSTISTVSATANAKNKTYRQASAPTSGMTAGDLWFDSDASNKPYRYSGSAWVATEDTRIATNTAAIQTEQTARANADSALSSTISTVSATANAKNKTYRQASAPTSGMTAGDLWFDSDASNKPYRYSGSAWVATEDTRIATNTAAIQTEATARADADSAIASNVTTLQTTVGNNTSAIQIVEDVRMGEVNVFRQATAPTTGMITGDLWVNNNEVVYRYEGGEWVSKEGTPVYDLLKTAIAQYVVKTQTVTGDGQLKVAGFGLYNDSTTGSEFAILADKFYVYGQKEDGSSYSNIQVFTVDATTTPPTVGINGNLIVNGSIVGEKIFAGSKIQLNSGGELVIGSGGKLQVGDELSSQFSLDSSVGVITVREPGNITYGEYMQISVGQIKSYKWYEGAHREMKILRAIETGTATNGVYKTTTGRFTGIPSIVVTPNSVPTFMYQETGTQMISFTATNITHDANTGRVTFLPTARLESLGAGSSFYVSPPTQEGAWNNPSAQGDYCLPSVQEITHTFSTHTVPAGNGTYTITGACISGPALRSYEWGNNSDSYTGTMYVEVRETQGTGSAGAWTVVSQIAFPRSTIIYASPWASAMPGGSIASHWVPFSFTRNIGLSTIKVEIRIRHVLGVQVRYQNFYHLSTHAGYGAYSRIDSFSYQQPGKVFAQGGGVLNYMAISG